MIASVSGPVVRRCGLALGSLLALASMGAAQLTCTPPAVTLRPGASGCIAVLGPVGATVTPAFDSALVSVVPASSIIGQGGSTEFVVTCLQTQLSGTPVSFDAPGTSGCVLNVTCDEPRLTLRGTAGSYPGTFSLELIAETPVSPPIFGVVAFGFSPGPIPLFPLSPGDPRILNVAPPAFTAIPRLFGAPFLQQDILSTPLGSSFSQAVLFAQGLTLDLSLNPIDRLTQPAPIWFSDANEFWDRGSQLNFPRSFFPMMFDRIGRPVIAGGGEGGIFAQIARDTVEYFEPVTDSFVLANEVMTMERSLHTATQLQNGKWLLVGGVDRNNDPTATAEIYDPETGRFIAVASMSQARAGHAATLMADGRVLVSGGLGLVSAYVIPTIQGALDTTEYFTLDATGCNGTFAPGPNMTRARAGHGTIDLADGRLMVLGGVGSFFGVPAIWPQTEFFDGVSFSSGPTMPNQRAIFPIVQISSSPDQYLVAGGLNSILGLGAPTNRVDVYTAVPGGQGFWNRAGNMAAARGIQAAYRFGNEVYQFGGLQGDLATPIAIGSTEIYDIPSGTWRQGPTMSLERGAYGSYVNEYGIVHFIGGAEGSSPNPPVGTTSDWFFFP
ncbi:MAG: kelch repeat-containing protein [Planctomycetota bacterium]